MGILMLGIVFIKSSVTTCGKNSRAGIKVPTYRSN